MPFLPRLTAAPIPPVVLAIVLATVLAGCGPRKAATSPADVDPAIAGALGDEIMVDPDLARQNPHNAALTGGGPASAAIPPQDKSPEAIAAARAEAVRLAGGPLQRAPKPSGPPPAQSGASSAGQTAVLTASIALGRNGAGTGRDCAAKADYKMGWAAKLPAPFPVYPRGHVQEAAGTDADGCRLRVVNFVTPVPLDEVADFYWTRARSAGFAAAHRLDGADRVIEGAKGAAAYVVYLRHRDGLTEVDLVTNGG